MVGLRESRKKNPQKTRNKFEAKNKSIVLVQHQ